MNETIVLAAVGVSKGNSGDGFQYYQVLGRDESDQQFMITFGVKQCYTESAEKTFKRMFAVDLPEPTSIPSVTIASPDVVVKELTEYEKLLLED